MTPWHQVFWWKFLAERFAAFNRAMVNGSTVHIRRDMLDYYHHACRN